MARILVVDDEKAIRKTIKAFLTQNEYEVHVAEDADEALRIVENHEIDVVLSDIIMPRMNGVELMTVIKRRFPTIEVILITGEPNLDTAVRAVREGAFDYIAKPVSLLNVRSVVAQAARAKALTDENQRLRRELEQRSAAIFHGVAEGVLIVDVESGHFILANPAVREMLGYTEAELLEKTIADICPEADLPRVSAAFEARASEKQSLVQEISCVRKDGTVFPADINATPLVIDGKPCAVGFFRDVTNRMESRAALTNNLEGLRILNELLQLSLGSGALDEVLRNALAMVLATPFLSTLRRGAIFLVDEGERTLRLRVHQGMTPALLSECGRVPFGRCLCGQAAESGEIQFADHVDKRHKNQYEDMAPHGHYCVPIQADGFLHGVLVLYLDPGHTKDESEMTYLKSVGSTLSMLVKHKQTGAALQESEAQLRGMSSAAQDAIVMMDENGRITFWNLAAKRVFGYGAEEALGQDLHELLVPEASRRRFLENHGAFLKTGEGALIGKTLEMTAIRENGEQFPVELSLSGVRGSGGWHAVGIVRDITDRLQLEERLRHAEKMEAVGKLAGGIAHDFNNQLTGIMGYADMLASRLDNERFRGYARSIVRGVRRASDLTAQLLAFSRKGMYLSEPVDLHAIINEIVELLRHSADKRISLRQHMDASPSTTIGDPTQLQNAILNLAFNACDAMPSGGVLCFSTEVVALDESWCRRQVFDVAPGQYILVSVRDSGVGMDQQIRKRIFEPFFTTKEEGKGTGMGLAAVYGTVKHHNGCITVESEPGRGADFRMYLPLTEARVREKTGPRERKPRDQTARILVVDDEEMVRELSAEILQGLNHEVTTCKDGMEAVEFYRKSSRSIDLVILDMTMPRMNGRDAFLAMRAINPDIKALLSSGYSVEGEARELLNEGVLGFLQKPFEMDQLSRKVDDVLFGGE